MKHKSKGCRFSYVAWQTGYSNARFDGIDTSGELPCQCRNCMAAYQRGIDEGVRKALELSDRIESFKKACAS